MPDVARKLTMPVVPQQKVPLKNLVCLPELRVTNYTSQHQNVKPAGACSKSGHHEKSAQVQVVSNYSIMLGKGFWFACRAGPSHD